MEPRITVTDSERSSLVEEFGEASVRYHAKVCSDWLVANGKTKKSAAAFMRNWIRREIAEQKGYYSKASRGGQGPKSQAELQNEYREREKQKAIERIKRESEDRARQKS